MNLTLISAFGGARCVKMGEHQSLVRAALTFSPKGRHVLTGSYDNTARLWNLETGKPIRALEGHTGHMFSVHWSPDGRWALKGSAAGL